jgi:hypothetical protein
MCQANDIQGPFAAAGFGRHACGCVTIENYAVHPKVVIICTAPVPKGQDKCDSIAAPNAQSTYRKFGVLHEVLELHARKNPANMILTMKPTAKR